MSNGNGMGPAGGGRHGQSCGRGLGRGQGEGKGLYRAVRDQGATARATEGDVPPSAAAETTMRIAVPTDDGFNVASHLGRAGRFVVVEVRGTEITGRTERTIAAGPHHHGGHGSHDDHHAQIRTALGDATVVLIGGGGRRILAELEDAGLEIAAAAAPTVDEAVQRYLSGERPAVIGCAGHGEQHRHGPHHH